MKFFLPLVREQVGGTKLWAVLFFGGWIYAIFQFGFFLGLALGWIPAFFFALIFEQIIVYAVAFAIIFFPDRYRPVR